jgi:hypothetical protein
MVARLGVRRAGTDEAGGMKGRVILSLSGLLVLAGLGPAAAFGAARAYVLPDWSPVPAESPWHAARADLDGDGTADLAVVDRTHDAVTVLLTGSGGKLTTKGSYPSPDAPMAVATADSTGGDVTTMFNDVSGSLTAGPQIDLGPESPEIRVNIAAADLDGDHDLDLVVNDGRLVVLRNDGSGHFAIAGTYDASFVPNGLAVADLDGDGDADVATADDANRIVVMLNDGDGTLAPAGGSPFDGGSGLSSIVAGDLDRDGDVDLATINIGPPGNPGTAAVLLNDGSAHFTRPADRVVALNGNPGAFDLGDLDGDARRSARRQPDAVDVAIGVHHVPRVVQLRRGPGGRRCLPDRDQP